MPNASMVAAARPRRVAPRKQTLTARTLRHAASPDAVATMPRVDDRPVLVAFRPAVKAQAELLKLNTACEVLDCSRATLYRLIAGGVLERIFLGWKPVEGSDAPQGVSPRITRASIDKFLAPR